MRHRFRFQSVGWLLLLGIVSWAQSPLQQLRDQLVATNGWRDHDVVAVLSQRALNDTAQRLSGLEIKLTNGTVMKITGVTLELKPAVALVKLGVQVDPSSKLKTAHFRLWGTLGGGEMHGASLRFPFQLTNVAFGTEDGKSLSLMRMFLRDWLSPAKWNDVLPPLEIPLQLNPTIDLPAATFEAGGELPMTIAMPAYQVPFRLTLAALALLEGRAVIALNVEPRAAPLIPAQHAAVADEASLANEIARLSEHLALTNDVHLRVRKAALNAVLAQLAAAREVDLTVKLKQGRIRAEEVDALVSKIVNYTDVESGEGKADVGQLLIEEITAARVNVRLTGQGELQVNVKGREYGVPYNLAPRGRFAIQNEVLPLEILSRNDRVLVRAAAGTVVPVRVNLTIDVLGRPLGLTRTVNLQADQWLKDFELPAILTQEISLPRQLAFGKNNELNIVRSEPSRYTVANLRIETKEERLEIFADIK